MAKIIMVNMAITRKITVAMEMTRKAMIRKITARSTRNKKKRRKRPVKAVTLDFNPKIVSVVGQ